MDRAMGTGNLNKIHLETERLILREFQETDWAAVHAYAKQGDILIYEPWGPNTEADTIEFIKTVLEEQMMEPRDSFDLAIILKGKQKLIGGCSFWFVDIEYGQVNIGYIIEPAYWKQGYATEATNGLIELITARFDFSTITATCDVLNMASQAVLIKCGFKLKSTVMHHIEMKGRWRDTYVFEKRLK